MTRDLETAVGLLPGRRRWAAMWVIALVGIVAIACGGDDDPTRVPAAPAAEPTASTAAPTATALPPTAMADSPTVTAPSPTPNAQPVAPTTTPAGGDAMMDDDGMSMAMMAQGHASLAIAIAGLADSGQDGVAILVDKGDQTEVVLNIASGAADVPQPADIHTGTCDALGGVNHSLAHVVNGISLTMVDANLASLLTGDFAINVHHSGDDIGTYVACGNVPAGASQATVALSAMNDSGQDGTATLIDMGADTTVVVSVAQGEGDAPQPIHIHAGTCEDLGGVEHALTTAASGFSVTTVAESMSNLLGGGLAINLHKSGSETSVYVACGNLASGEAKVDDGIMSSSGVLASAIAQFSLENLTISVGDTVSWTNQDNAPHTVSAGVSPNVDSPPQFRSATMARNGTFTHTFTTAGTFAYFCEIHPSMIAQVTVK